MNRTYRIVRSRKSGLWTVAAELARGRGKGAGAGTLAAALLLPLAALAADLPTGGNVVSGSGGISQSGTTLTVRQDSARLIATWQRFDIGAGHTVNFVQPSASAIALNRVLGSDTSQILGALNANGQVWLVNPNGVLFGKSAQVNVGGLVASTLDIRDEDFLAGRYVFSGSGGTVSNQGTLRAADGGAVALLGGKVSNQGLIEARLGAVALAAGNQVTLDFAGDGLLNVRIDRGQLDALVENHGAISADGGSVLLTTHAAEQVLNSVVNNTGVIEAHTVENRAGRIVLLADMQSGAANVGGTLAASAPKGGNGGFIETSGHQVKVADGAKITTLAASGSNGQWLIDPYDFTIAPSGGDITGAALSTALNNNAVTIQTTDTGVSVTGATAGAGNAAGNGDIFVNDVVEWSANTTLTLDAYRSVFINAPMTASGGSAGLTVKYNDGGTGGNFFAVAPVNLAPGAALTINGDAYTRIDSLAGITDFSAAGRYFLGGDVAQTGSQSPLAAFAGTLEGLGHTVSGVNIARDDTDVGLFSTNSGTLRNFGVSGSVAGHSNSIGLLAGSNTGTIVNVRASGTVAEQSPTALRVGGLVGNNSGSILNASADVIVTGSSGNSIGGLAGRNAGTISNSHATGSVSDGGAVGGLVGLLDVGGSIAHSYATGTVASRHSGATVGGLVGNGNGNISYAYATGAVTGNATGSLAGGLVGIQAGGTLDNVWASGAVSGDTAGGLIGRANSIPTVTGGHWDRETTGRNDVLGNGALNGASSNVSGLTSAESFVQANYTGFDFTDGWFMSGVRTGSPYNTGGSFRPMLRSEWSAGITNLHQLQLMDMNLAASYTLLRDLDATETAVAMSGGSQSGMWGTDGWRPVGMADDVSDGYFSGNFDGRGHAISNLTTHRDVLSNGTGLFGNVRATTGRNVTLKNIGLLDVNITGGPGATGAVAGRLDRTGSGTVTVSNAYADGGSVTARNTVGGLVGVNQTGSSIDHSYANVSVEVTGGSGTANANAGGLVGANVGNISYSYASGSVTGSDASTADGSATNQGIGGLVGTQNGGGISYSYATGAVGLAPGALTTNARLGGLIGNTNSTSTVTSSYWDKTTTGQSTSASAGVTGTATGLTTDQWLTNGPFVQDPANWNAATWIAGNPYPGIKTLPYIVITGSGSQTYGSAASFSLAGILDWYGADATGLVNIDSLVWQAVTSATTAAGTTVAVAGSGATATGYQILYAGSLTVGKADLTLSGSRAYDGTTVVAGNWLTATGVNGETFALAGAGDASNLLSKNVQTGSTLASVTGLTLGTSGNGGVAGNYNALSTAGSSFSITPLSVTLAAPNVTKTYDGDTTYTVTAADLTALAASLAGGDTVTAATISYTDKNAGTGTKTVTLDAATISDGNDGHNYTVTLAGNGSSTIAKALATVTANSATVIYNGAVQSVSGFTASGLVGGEDESVLAGLAETGGSGKDAGSYAHGLGVGTYDGNYDLSFVGGTLTIAVPNTVDAAYTGALASAHGLTRDTAGQWAGNGIMPVAFLPPRHDETQADGAPGAGSPPYAIVGSGIRLPEGF